MDMTLQNWVEALERFVTRYPVEDQDQVIRLLDSIVHRVEEIDDPERVELLVDRGLAEIRGEVH